MVTLIITLLIIFQDAQESNPETNSEFGSWASDSRTQTNLVKTSETLNMKSQKQANVLSTAIFAEGEALGLGADLCQDLAVLISGPRVKTLTWDMERYENRLFFLASRFIHLIKRSSENEASVKTLYSFTHQ